MHNRAERIRCPEHDPSGIHRLLPGRDALQGFGANALHRFSMSRNGRLLFDVDLPWINIWKSGFLRPIAGHAGCLRAASVQSQQRP
jgi:hypothetical protein